MGTLGTLTSELARWYGRRLKYLWITTVNQGLGFFVLYAVLVVFGIHWARQSVDLRTKDEEVLDKFLQSEHEVRDEDNFVSAVSVVLSAVDPARRITTNSCPGASSECFRARTVLSLTTQLAQILEDGVTDENWRVRAVALLSQYDLTEREVKDVLGELDGLIQQEKRSANVAVTARADNTLARQSEEGEGAEPGVASAAAAGAEQATVGVARPLGHDCARGEWVAPALKLAAEQMRKQFRLVEAYCVINVGNLSGLLVPEQVAHIPRGRDDEAKGRVERTMYISSALEAALQGIVAQAKRQRAGCPCCSVSRIPKTCSTSEDPIYSFVAAYFIGVDSVIRYWHLEPGDPIERLPRNREWAAPEYFTHFLQPENANLAEYVSRPYLDFAGAGVVQTICHRVLTETSARNAITAGRIMPGIVCVDLALRPSEMRNLVKRIQEGPFVSAGLLRIDATGSAQIESPPNQNALRELQDLIDSLQWQTVFKPQFTGGTASRSTSKIKGQQGNWYIVPIGRIDKDQFAIALRPALSSGVGRLWRWAMLGAIFGAALVLLTFTAQQSRRLSVAQRDLARLRGLTAGVIECQLDPEKPSDYLNQKIVAGNDRAEEVLQTQLINFGLTTGQKPTLFSLVNHEAIVETAADGVTPLGRITPEQIEARRRHGDTSAYYVQLRESREVALVPAVARDSRSDNARLHTASFRWVRMAAGPVILPRWRLTSVEARGRLESTLGIVEPVWSKELAAQLDRVLAQKPSLNQGPATSGTT